MIKEIFSTLRETLEYGLFYWVPEMGWRILYNTIFTYGVGFVLIVLGITSLFDNLSVLNSTQVFNVGGIIGSVMCLSIAVLGFIWIIQAIKYTYEYKSEENGNK